MKELVGMLVNEYKSFDVRESGKKTKISIKVSNEFWDKYNKVRVYCKAMERHIRHKFDKKNLRGIIENKEIKKEGNHIGVRE